MYSWNPLLYSTGSARDNIDNIDNNIDMGAVFKRNCWK